MQPVNHAGTLSATPSPGNLPRLLDLLVKDLGIALGVARDTATPVPFSSLCRELALAAQAMVGPGRDHTELAIVSERLAGRELPIVSGN